MHIGDNLTCILTYWMEMERYEPIKNKRENKDWILAIPWFYGFFYFIVTIMDNLAEAL